MTAEPQHVIPFLPFNLVVHALLLNNIIKLSALGRSFSAIIYVPLTLSEMQELLNFLEYRGQVNSLWVQIPGQGLRLEGNIQYSPL